MNSASLYIQKNPVGESLDIYVSNQKTKKKKKNLSVNEKSKLWEIFDKDNLDNKPENRLECIYEQNKEFDLCNICNSMLMIMDDGFPTCTNVSCGVIYKNTLDYSPEWSFYGVDDKNSTDPTRCGNPINPLLLESSHGCKLLFTPKSTHNRKKIQN